ncbi:MAG: hypothetical protein CMB38_00960 [Euryarchaeota archaeon]|nr:hypothetical protein [Euryarchaeota archaeon]
MDANESRTLTAVGVISALVLVVSLGYEFLLHEEEEVSFIIAEDVLMEDVDRLASFGPRVAGSAEETLATEYISQRFTEIGLQNVRVEEFDVTGAWFVDADPDEHQILMHAQLEAGVQNGPGLPDGTAGSGRVAIDETGSLNHIESFTFLGYSGANHKHDNILTFLGNGSSEAFANVGDLTDLAVMIEYDSVRSLADIYRDAIDRNAGVVMIYTVGVETPPFRSVTVQEDGATVPFPDAYGGQYADALIPYIYISESVAMMFHDFIEQSEDDPTLHASLDGFWEGNNVGTRSVKVVTGELPGQGDGEILIGAHHDSVYISPGAVDNAVGVSQMFEVASQLQGLSLESTVTFATWGGEELGLLGSQAYIEAYPDEIEDLDLYINLDSTNLDPTKGLGTLGIEASEQGLATAVSKIGEAVLEDARWEGYNAAVSLNSDAGNSDHRAFNQHDVTTVGLFGWSYEEHHRQTDVPNVVNEDGLPLAVEVVLRIVMAQGGHQSVEEPLIQISGLEGESNSWVFPFVLALLAGLATGLGGLIVFIVKEISPEMMAFLLAMAAGVMLLVSFLDLWFRQALDNGFLPITASFGIGVFIVFAVSMYTRKGEDVAEMSHERKLYTSGMLTAIALAIHNFPEGLAMGVAVQESAQYGLVLMAAIALHNIPEGVAVAAPIQAGGGGRLKATLIAMGTGLTEPLGALFALLILGPILTPFSVGCALAFVGGIMTVVACKELIPQAWNQDRPRHMVVGALFGAAVMQLSLLLLG